MMEITLKEEQIKKIEILAKLSVPLCNEALNTALKKAIKAVMKIEISIINDIYTVDSFVLDKGIKSTTKNGEGIISASTKKSDVYNFTMDAKKPQKRKKHISALIKKSSGNSTMRTMFWAFYKNNTGKLGLYKRTSSDRNKIAPFKTVSVAGMAQELNSNQLVPIIDIFYKELDKKLGALI